MTKLGDTPNEVLSSISQIAAKDLSEILETQVVVYNASNYESLTDNTTGYEEWNHKRYDKSSYITIEDEYPIDGVLFNTYTETPELLNTIDTVVGKEYYHSALLRSRCRVTSQPDTGDVYIYIKGQKTVDPISLLKYIISFRDECHFHEEICEATEAQEPDCRCLFLNFFPIIFSIRLTNFNNLVGLLLPILNTLKFLL
jgi:7-cyano-7-deazaguanine reductase